MKKLTKIEMHEKEEISVIYIGTYNKNEILSGPEKVAKRIFEKFSETKKTLFVNYFQDGKNYNYFKKLFGYKKEDEVNGSEILLLGIFRMIYHIIKLKPDIIHILNFNRFVIFLYLLKIFIRVKIYYNLHGIIRHENKYYNKESIPTMFKNMVIENVIIYSSDKIFYLSDFSKKILLLYYSLNNERLYKTRNGIDDCFLKNQISDSSNIEQNSVVFIGNIDRKEKGFSFLMETLLLIDVPINIYIIDDKLKKLQIENYKNIRFDIIDKLPPKNMIEFFRNKQIFVSTSEYDPFPIAVLEAISCGLYPILTKQTGVCEVMGEYSPLSIIDYGDKESLAFIINNLINNKLQFKFSKNLNDFSWLNIFKKYYLPYYN